MSEDNDNALPSFIITSLQDYLTNNNHTTPIGLYYDWTDGKFLKFDTTYDKATGEEWAYGFVEISHNDEGGKMKFIYTTVHSQRETEVARKNIEDSLKLCCEWITEKEAK
jgi:hypothetical protein